MPRTPLNTRPRHSVNVRLDLDTYEKIKAYAIAKDRTVTYVVTTILDKAAARIDQTIGQNA